MAPPIYAGLIRSERETLTRANALDLAERERLHKMELTGPGLEKALAPIDRRLKDRFEAARVKATHWHDEAKARYLKFLPEAVQRSAALLNPAKAAAVMALLTGASVRELAASAEVAAEAKDQVMAWPIRLALRAVAQDTPGVAAIAARLEEIAGDVSTDALADFVGAGVELGRLVSEGPFLDLGAQLVADPAAFLARAHAVGVIPWGSGEGSRTLSDAEVERLCVVAGVPQRAAA